MSTNPRRAAMDQPSNHLWVGSLPFDISETELSKLFAKYGVVDEVHSHSSKNYAFVYFRSVDEAVAAKTGLQGFVLDGNRIKIEFAKPARASRHVWIGGFHLSTSKEKLEEQFSKFGEIEDFKFNRDKNTAIVDYVRLEDASAAVKSLNGLKIGDDHIRVDYMRSQPARREQTDFVDMGRTQFKGAGGFDRSWMDPDIMRNYPDPTFSGHKRPLPPHSVKGRRADNPSKVLWVGYPPSIVIDEEMLHNAMILHGEIEKIKCYPDRHYSFVEFRSIDEARRAKEALEGRLFNDPRIAIMFSNSNSGPAKDDGPPFSGFRGQRPDMYGNEGPFRPLLIDMFPPNHPMTPYIFSGPNGMTRPFVPRGNLDSLHQTSDFHDHSVRSDLADMNHRISSPSSAGLLPSPTHASRPAYKKSGWDVVDPNHPPRGPKRSRIDGPTYHDHSLPAAQVDEYADQPHGPRPPFGSVAFARDRAGKESSPGDIGAAKGHVQGHGNNDHIWRGVIAKGGTPVCRARCIPIGNGLEFELPEMVNCSARTGLDMLAKHHAAALEFDIVFFLPDSEDDFANYTEFLRYLGSKNRAGVAKLADGTTLFLVPPSDFLTDVLKVTGRERLYGVVLKMQPSVPTVVTNQPLPPLPQMGRQVVPPTHESVVSKQDFPIQMDYNTAAREVAMPPPLPRVPYPTTSVPQAQSNDLFSAASGPLSLTPELIASLQSLQSATQSSIAQSAQKNVSSFTTVPPPPPISSNEGGVYGWSQQPPIHAPTGQPSQSFGVQSYSNAPLTNTFQSFPANQNVNSHQVPSIPDNMSMQNHAYNLQQQVLQQQGSVASSPALTHHVGQQFVPLSQGTQPYHFEAPQNAQKNYAMMHGTTGSYGVADNNQQPNYPGSYSNQPREVISSHQPESLNLAERLQPVPSGVGGQGTSEVEVDKNERYQHTLQFAASLLLQIQQQQQQQQGSSNTGNQK